MDEETLARLSASVELRAEASELRWQLHETLIRHREILGGVIVARLHTVAIHAAWRTAT